MSAILLRFKQDKLQFATKNYIHFGVFVCDVKC
jgi:hypothetical protein